MKNLILYCSIMGWLVMFAVVAFALLPFLISAAETILVLAGVALTIIYIPVAWIWLRSIWKGIAAHNEGEK